MSTVVTQGHCVGCGKPILFLRRWDGRGGFVVNPELLEGVSPAGKRTRMYALHYPTCPKKEAVKANLGERQEWAPDPTLVS